MKVARTIAIDLEGRHHETENLDYQAPFLAISIVLPSGRTLCTSIAFDPYVPDPEIVAYNMTTYRFVNVEQYVTLRQGYGYNWEQNQVVEL